MNVIFLDIEANNLYPYQTKTWTICLKRLSGEKLKLNPFRSTKEVIKQQLLDFIFKEENPTIVGHNYLGFDGWVLWKDFDLEMHVGKDTICGKPVTFFDTLFGSQFLYPDREDKHSLESWGKRLGLHKIDYYTVAVELGIIPKGGDPFSVWSEQMDEYCENDIEITEKVYIQLSRQIEAEDSLQAFKLGQKNFFLMNAQAFTGFKFDVKKATDLKVRVEQMIVDLKNEVEPDLPKRKLKKAEEHTYSIPAKPFKKKGGYSAVMENFIKKHNAEVLGDRILAYDTVVMIAPGVKVLNELPMLLSDQNQLKEYFLSLNWIPTMWNYKQDKSGKPMRDPKGKLIKTSPKIQENGKICENLNNLDGDLPKKIVKFLSLRNRLGILTGWLENPRLAWDGRLPAGSTGIASTHRQKHTVIVNVPKAQDDVLLGKEFRSLFTVEGDNRLIGCDQAALEARCEAHWVHDFEGGKERVVLLLHKDIHNHNTKIFFKEETKQFDINASNFSKDDKGFKPYRSLSKNGGYALAYGCTPKKLATTLRKPESEATRLYDAYWEANPSLKKLKDKVEYTWEREGNKKWIKGIDGRRLYSRSKHSLINLLFQSTAAIIVDYALCLFDMKMGNMKIDQLGRPYYSYKGKIVKRTGYFHDESIAEVDPLITEEVARIKEQCMVEAGVRLKLNVPLVGESKIGLNWAETH